MRSLRYFEVLFISQIDIRQARIVSTQEEMEAKIDIPQEKLEAAVHSIWSELEETVKHGVEDDLLCVDQKTWDLRKELNEKIDETQMDLQAVKSSLDMRMKSLQETQTDMGNDIHEELGLMLQVETQTMRSEIRISQERMEAKIEAT
jgi:hypothetical protein